MEPNVILKQYKDTIYSCRVLGSKYCEEMVVEHMLVYLYSGALDLIEKEGKKHTVKKGDFFFVPKNHRLTKVKRSVGNEPLERISGGGVQKPQPFFHGLQEEVRPFPEENNNHIKVATL